MKTLYIVRHAKSSWKYPELSDFDRPLNKRGKRDAPEMGRRLAKRNIHPDLMLSSPAKRALDAAKAIANEIGYSKKNIKTDTDIYHAGSEVLLDIVRAQKPSLTSIMIFGHNPGFTSFANLLTSDSNYNIPTTGIYAVSFDVDIWTNIQVGMGTKVFYDFPKKITSPRLE